MRANTQKTVPQRSVTDMLRNETSFTITVGLPEANSLRQLEVLFCL